MKKALALFGVVAISVRCTRFLTSTEGQTVIRDHIKPRHIIAVHISPDESERTITQIKQAFPGAVAFTTMLEKRLY